MLMRLFSVSGFARTARRHSLSARAVSVGSDTVVGHAGRLSAEHSGGLRTLGTSAVNREGKSIANVSGGIETAALLRL